MNYLVTVDPSDAGQDDITGSIHGEESATFTYKEPMIKEGDDRYHGAVLMISMGYDDEDIEDIGLGPSGVVESDCESYDEVLDEVYDDFGSVLLYTPGEDSILTDYAVPQVPGAEEEGLEVIYEMGEEGWDMSNEESVEFGDDFAILAEETENGYVVKHVEHRDGAVADDHPDSTYGTESDLFDLGEDLFHDVAAAVREEQNRQDEAYQEAVSAFRSLDK